MAQPTPYEPGYDFSDFQTANPADPLPGDKLDIELGSIATAVQQLCTNIGLIQRDDGQLRNGVTTIESLSSALLNLIATQSLVVRGAWLTATAYAVGDIVTETGGTYVAATAHTSGTFATDFSAGKWVLLASTAASTAAAFIVTGASAPAEGIYKPAASTLGLSAGGLDVMRLVGVASAVNYFTVTNSATGNPLLIDATGTDTNIGVTLTPKGSGVFGTTSLNVTGSTIPAQGAYLSAANTLSLSARSLKALELTNAVSAVNYVGVMGNAAGSSPTVRVDGSDTDISFRIQSKGAGVIFFATNAGAQIQFDILHTASVVNNFRVTGAITGAGPVLNAIGTDTNIDARFYTKGTGAHKFYSNAGAQLQFEVAHVASAVNYLQVKGNASGSHPSINALGSGTNVNIDMVAKGTGGVRIGVLTDDGVGSSGQSHLIIGPYTMNDVGTLTNWRGISVTMPVLSSFASISAALGVNIAMPSITGTNTAINTYGLNIQGVAVSGASTVSGVYGINVGGGTADGTAFASLSNHYGIYIDNPTYSNGLVLNTRIGLVIDQPTVQSSTALTNAIGIQISGPSVSSATITNSYGILIGNQGASGVTTSYGIQIAAQSGSTTSWVINYNSSAFFVDSGGFMKDAGRSRVSTQFDSTADTTLDNVPGLTATVLAAGVYRLRASLTVSAGASGGIKVAIGGTATATSLTATAWNYNGTTINAVSTVTALATAAGGATAVATNVIIEGMIVVNAAGTLTVQAAQNASNGTATSILVGSTFSVERIA